MKLIPFFFMLLCYSANAQQVISSLGASSDQAELQVSMTMGETITPTWSNGSISITQGFHQPQITATSIEETGDFTWTIYPNPTMDVLHIRGKKEWLGSATITLWDAFGNQIRRAQLNQGEAQKTMDLRSFAAGSYLISIHSEDVKSSFKIIKRK